MNLPIKPNVPFLDLDLLNTLVAIAEGGNFSAAAEIVHRTPSAVSMQVKRIEELLGRPIFLRDSRAVTLTEDGDMLLLHAKRVLALNRQIVSQFISPDILGVVRLGAIDHATEQFLPAVLKRFSETHPGVTVDVTVEDSIHLIDMINRNKLDVAIVTCGSAETCDVEQLYREKLVWAGLKCGIAVEQDPLPVSVWEKGCIWRKEALDGLERQNRDYRITFKSAHLSAQKAGILADLVVAPFPLSACEGQIIALGEESNLPPLPDYTLGMLVTKNAIPPVKAVVDHLRASLADRN